MNLHRKCQKCGTYFQIVSECSKKIFCSDSCRFQFWKANHRGVQNKRQETTKPLPNTTPETFHQQYFKAILKQLPFLIVVGLLTLIIILILKG